MKKFDKKRDAIKQAGIKSFAAYGFYKTTLEDIAGMLGMKKNSLYYYFENKEALFKEIIEDTLAEFSKYLTAILQTDISASEKMMRVARHIPKLIQERTIKYSITLSSYLEISNVIRKSFPGFQQGQKVILETILKEGISNNEFRKHDTKQLAADICKWIPAVFNNNYLISESRFVSEVEFDVAEKEIERLVQYLLNGIRVKPL